MPIHLAVPREVTPGERRVALDPASAARFAALGVTVTVERGAGLEAHFQDQDYQAKASAQLVDDAKALYENADLVLKVQPPTPEERSWLKAGAILVGLLRPFGDPDFVVALQRGNITAFALELLPRISRAQSMDALSSQAAVAGYRAGLMAAHQAPTFFPMLTTAAGTIRPARVVVIGAGVAGLQAIATCKRLGAQVEAYDIRAAAREQVESLGAKMIDTGVSAEAEGGYARELSDEEKNRQADALTKRLAAASAVVCTAAVPGKRAPLIVTQAMVEAMASGAVVIDLAAEGGGNCALTKPGETVVHGGVTVVGPLNVPSQTPVHASEMYAKNLYNFTSPLIRDGEIQLPWDDEVVARSALTHGGEIRAEAVRQWVEQTQAKAHS
ncbi:MAG: NAD(P) transhydrogenase subunit alpha [Candidatus Competibacterales bacterium]